MPRYVKQRDHFRCGPIVILNALKWAGVEVSSSEHLDYLTELTACGPPPRGTWHGTFDPALRAAGKGFYSVRRVHHPPLGRIETHLQDGGAVVFNYFWRKEKEGTEGRHFHLLVGMSSSGNSFYVVNRGRRDPTFKRVHRETFKKEDLRCTLLKVGFLNALKWAGVEVSSSEHLDYLTELTACGPPPRGTWHGTFDPALRAAGKGFYSVRRVHHPPLGRIETHLQDGGAVVFNYFWRKEKEGTEGRHFHLLVGMSSSGNSFYVVNRGRRDPTFKRVHRETFKKEDLRFQRADPNYKAWFLTRAGE